VLENFHFGLFFDWDMSSLTAGSNVAGYEPTLKMGHVHDTSDEGPKVYAGVQLLSNLKATYRAIYNDQDHPDNQSWGLYDGFSDQEKWQAISAGTIYTTAGPADISNCLSAGPLVIQQNESISLTFALLGGEDLDDMKQNANAAKQLFDKIENTRVKQDVVYSPEKFLLEQNHPNPFNPQTSIHYQLPEGSDVELTIYNIMGQKIKTLVDMFQVSGFYRVSWDGLDEFGTRVPTGTFIYKLKAGDFMQKRKMLLLK
jgi:hypothetical protein